MAIYNKFTGNTTDTELIVKNSGTSGNIRKILIACTHDTVDLIIDRLYLDDATNEYDIISNVKIPVGTTLVLEDNLSFSSSEFDLKITTTNSSNCSIIIK